MEAVMKLAPGTQRSNEFPRHFFAGCKSAGIVVADRLRESAAECCREVLRRPAKQLQPYVTPQAYSECRCHGGALGGVAVLMFACPESAQALAAHLQHVADCCSDALRRSLPQMTAAAVSAIAHYLVTMHQYVQYPNSPAALRELMAATQQLIAALREQELAAAQRLASLEEPRRTD